MPKDKSIKKVLVIGSGPIVIGQAAEFDYAGTQACRLLMEEGVEAVLVTVSYTHLDVYKRQLHLRAGLGDLAVEHDAAAVAGLVGHGAALYEPGDLEIFVEPHAFHPLIQQPRVVVPGGKPGRELYKRGVHAAVPLAWAWAAENRAARGVVRGEHDRAEAPSPSRPSIMKAPPCSCAMSRTSLSPRPCLLYTSRCV